MPRNNIYQYWLESGRTQEDVAKEIGIRRPSFNHIMHGKRNTTVVIALRIARVFNTTVEALYGEYI
jgi:putative transcriptional regulator